ncbi:hypothetical protein NCCP28_23320 [Niallia sp. NCCP-28]|nr:hypothetical protein NCCP28_23320 [Niallia sp. NCCP-28]
MSISTGLTIMPIFVLLTYLVPITLTIYAIVKFYKLFKKRNEILKEISNKLDKLDK